MTPEQRLAFIRACERAGYTVDTEERRNGSVLIVSIRDGRGYVVRVMHPFRFDFEQAARDFAAFQQHGGKRHRTQKAKAA